MTVTLASFVATSPGLRFAGIETPGLVQAAIDAEVLKVRTGDALTDELVTWRVARRLASFEDKEFLALCDSQIQHLTTLLAAGGLDA